VSLRLRVLGSGSGGNATLVEAMGSRLLIDAGLGPRTIAERLEEAGVEPASLEAVLLSHEHGDHARGAVAFAKRHGVRLMGSAGTAMVGGFAEGGMRYDTVYVGQPAEIGALRVTPFGIPHDAGEPMGFVIQVDGFALGHVTDLGHMNRQVADALRPCDAVLIESNYDMDLLRRGPYPWTLKERILGPRGHLSNDDVARYVFSALGDTCRTLVLAHLSLKNNHPDVARMAVEDALVRKGRTEVRLEVCAPSGTPWIDVAAQGIASPASQLSLF
jgi:phosphoribosyl 1,2-cyclic phosphodiesterase